MPTAQARISVKRQPFGIYPAEALPLPDGSVAARLFVPHPDLLTVHEESMPKSVLNRAELSKGLWDKWRRDHFPKSPWLPGWLYGDDPDEANGYQFTDGMRRFREKATVRSIAGAVKRPKNDTWVASRARSGGKLNPDMIYHWLKWYAHLGWFKGWLIRGLDPSSWIRVVTEDEVRRCSAAWDYVKLAEEAEIPWPQATYGRWFDRPPTAIPDGPDRPAWVRWLYSIVGCRQAPAFVVNPKLQAYRRRGTVKAITKAAGLNRKTVKGWKKKPSLWKLLGEAITAAREGREANSDDFRSLPPNTREGMTRYARMATQAARCESDDVNISTSTVGQHLREADARGGQKNLQDYLDYLGPYQAAKYRRRFGLIAGDLFILSEEMEAFHESATNEWAAQKISVLENLPGFWDWFGA